MAVEFALVGVFLLLPLMFGMISFGFGLFAKTSATHAAREGARLAAVGLGYGPGGTTDTCATFAKEIAERGKGAFIDAADVTVDYQDDGTDADSDEDNSVEVTVGYDVELFLIGALVPGIPDTLELTEVGEARVERPSVGNASDGCSSAEAGA